MLSHSNKTEVNSMSIAERIYETVKTLSENVASEVLNFAEGLKAKQAEDKRIRRENALAVLAKYRGCFKASKFNREECYDR
jgi:hypothetical protein